MDEKLIKELVHEFVGTCPGHPSRDVLQFVSRMISSPTNDRFMRKKQAIMRSIIVMNVLRKEFINKGTKRCHSWYVGNRRIQKQFW